MLGEQNTSRWYKDSSNNKNRIAGSLNRWRSKQMYFLVAKPHLEVMNVVSLTSIVERHIGGQVYCLSLIWIVLT